MSPAAREIRLSLRRLVLRKRAVRSVWWGAWGIVLGLAAALLLALATRMAPIMAMERLRILSGLLLGCITLLVALAAALWRVDTRRLLIAAELALGLRGRLSTALDLHARSGDGWTPLSREQVQDAARYAGGADWRRVVPYRLPQPALFLVPALAISFLGVLISPDLQAGALAEKQIVAASQKKEAEEVRKAA